MLCISSQYGFHINTDSAAATINDLFGNELRTRITADDIDISKAVKIYVDTNVFEIPSHNLDDVKIVLEKGEYIYEIPVSVDDETVVLNIAKGRPLSDRVDFTEKEREQIIADEGKWVITAFTLHPDYKSYDKNFTVGDNMTYILVGGMPFFRAPAALIAEDGEIIAIAATGGAIPEFNDFSMNEENVYDYNAVKKYILENS
jgi:hypothetical protein